MNDVLLESALRIVRDAWSEHHHDESFIVHVEPDDWQLLSRVAWAFVDVGIEAELTGERGELLARRAARHRRSAAELAVA